jgi:hypothetical protein
MEATGLGSTGIGVIGVGEMETGEVVGTGVPTAIGATIDVEGTLRSSNWLRCKRVCKPLELWCYIMHLFKRLNHNNHTQQTLMMDACHQEINELVSLFISRLPLSPS